MTQSSGNGPSLTEAMGILMQALQNEAEIFIKLVSVYSKGGAGWEEVRETIERVYEQQQAPRPAAEPADAEPGDAEPGDAEPGDSESEARGGGTSPGNGQWRGE